MYAVCITVTISSTLPGPLLAYRVTSYFKLCMLIIFYSLYISTLLCSCYYQYSLDCLSNIYTKLFKINTEHLKINTLLDIYDGCCRRFLWLRMHIRPQKPIFPHAFDAQSAIMYFITFWIAWRLLRRMWGMGWRIRWSNCLSPFLQKFATDISRTFKIVPRVQHPISVRY